MKKSDFIALLRTLEENVDVMIKGRIHLPRICEAIAVDLWLNETKENEATAALRYQMMEVTYNDKFDFEEETPPHWEIPHEGGCNGMLKTDGLDWICENPQCPYTGKDRPLREVPVDYDYGPPPMTDDDVPF